MKGKVVHLQSLAWPVLFLIAGIASSFFDLLNQSATVIFALNVILITIIILWIRNYGFFPLDLIYTFSLILFFITGYGITQFQKTEFEKYSTRLSTNEYPKGTIYSITKYDKMDRIQVRIPGHKWWYPPHYFNVNLLDKNHTFCKGQVISITKPLTPIASSSLPFSFPAAKYWSQKNTSHEVFIRNAEDIRIIRDAPDVYINRFRDNAATRIEDIYPNATQAGILKALLLGKKEDVARDSKTVFKKAGLMHILAVSGLHVGIVSALFMIFLFPVKLIFPDSWIHYSLLIAGLWCYAALTGMNTPVVRAVILVTLYLTAQKKNRQIHKWNIYFWAVLLVLIIHPMAFFTVSFQLSFGAVAAILIFYKSFHGIVIPLLGRNYFSGLVAVSLAAQTGISPLLLLHFHEISLVSTLSSFLVIPLLFPLILISSISILIPASWDWIVTNLTRISEVILDIITGISFELANWEISSQTWVLSTGTMITLIVSLLFSGLYVEFRDHTSNKNLIHVALGMAILVVLFEGVNIYSKRKKPVMVLYKEMKIPVTELYYRGICYTSTSSKPPPYVNKNRRRYYIDRTILLSDQQDWGHLLSKVDSSIPTSPSHSNRNIEVYNYIQDQHYSIRLEPEISDRVFTQPRGSTTPLTSFNPD